MDSQWQRRGVRLERPADADGREPCQLVWRDGQRQDVERQPGLDAKGDGVTDDTAALRACLDACDNHDQVYFPAGTYMVSINLTLDGGTAPRRCGMATARA